MTAETNIQCIKCRTKKHPEFDNGWEKIKIRRLCEKCNARVVLAEELKDRIHAICQ